MSPSMEAHELAPAALEAPTSETTYVGGAACEACHAEETRKWRGSHHDRAMEVADAQTVLGDFEAPPLIHHGERFEFLRREGRFFVNTADAEGVLREFEVLYTFGVEPLQQYLVRLSGGRMQALSAAWDSRPAGQGGQRWFHLQPDDPVPPGDVLHWTGLAGSWNAQCADCHATNLVKGYRAEEDRYAPTWSDLDVACEACHGPGSRHVAWAESGADGEAPGRALPVALGAEGEWAFAEGQPIAHRVQGLEGDREVETCAPCHSRRSTIATAGAPDAPFLDRYEPALLSEGLYHADGQILEEVYVWGSFAQSRMKAAGVVCSDCHDPHSLRIDEPDAVCATCHQPTVFAAVTHHRHEVGSPGASCVACHMPARTYMEVDPRRDHSFRVPRPDLSESIGVPNPCNTCHEDQEASWAAAQVARWHGTGRRAVPHYGEILHAGRRRAVGAGEALAALASDREVPDIVRATALQLLGGQLDRRTVPALSAAFADPDPLVRMAATESAEALPPEFAVAKLEPLLTDPIRGVRIGAARVLAPERRHLSGPAAQRALDAAVAEYREAQAVNADRPEALVNLGNLEARLGRHDTARAAYERALERADHFVPAYVNLADLHRILGNDREGERVLRRGLQVVPESADLFHALGLLQVRGQRMDEALGSLEKAADLAPGNPRYGYVLGVAQDSAGQANAARATLSRTLASHPGDPEVLAALVTMHASIGDREKARGFAERLLTLRPDDPRAQALLRSVAAP